MTGVGGRWRPEAREAPSCVSCTQDPAVRAAQREYMFHRSALGPFGDSLPTDLRGYVPQEGDQPPDFVWDPRTEWTPVSWDAFVEEAVRATTEAREAEALGVHGMVRAASRIASGARARLIEEDVRLQIDIIGARKQLDGLVERARRRVELTGRLSAETAALEEAAWGVLAYLEALGSDLEDQA